MVPARRTGRAVRSTRGRPTTSPTDARRVVTFDVTTCRSGGPGPLQRAVRRPTPPAWRPDPTFVASIPWRRVIVSSPAKCPPPSSWSRWPLRIGRLCAHVLGSRRPLSCRRQTLPIRGHDLLDRPRGPVSDLLVEPAQTLVIVIAPAGGDPSAVRFQSTNPGRPNFPGRLLDVLWSLGIAQDTQQLLLTTFEARELLSVPRYVIGHPSRAPRSDSRPVGFRQETSKYPTPEDSGPPPVGPLHRSVRPAGPDIGSLAGGSKMTWPDA